MWLLCLHAPVETITQGLLLRYKPLNLDVLPLYVVLMGAFPPVLWLMLRHRNWVMLGSVLLYFAARQFGWNLPSYPSGVWYFNPFAWQLLFVLGAWLALGGANTLHFLVRSRAVLVLGLVYLLFAAVMTLAGQIPELQKLVSARSVRSLQSERQDQPCALSLPALGDPDYFRGEVHTDRCAGTDRRLSGTVVKCGQQSLEVFGVGIYLLLHRIFFAGNDRRWNFCPIAGRNRGLSIMTAVAYYRSWSKQIEKSVHAHPGRPAMEEPGVPISGPVEQGNRKVVVAV